MQKQPELKEVVAIIQQYHILQNYFDKISGIYIVPREEDIYIWDGVIFVNDGYWYGGIFKFTLTLNRGNILSAPPQVVFLTRVYHPYIDENTNVLDLNKCLPNWREARMNIINAIQYIKYIFETRNFSSKLVANQEAFDLCQKNPYSEEFQSKVKRCVSKSKKLTENPNHFSFVFSEPREPEDQEYYDQLKKQFKIEV